MPTNAYTNFGSKWQLIQGQFQGHLFESFLSDISKSRIDLEYKKYVNGSMAFQLPSGNKSQL